MYAALIQYAALTADCLLFVNTRIHDDCWHKIIFLPHLETVALTFNMTLTAITPEAFVVCTYLRVLVEG